MPQDAYKVEATVGPEGKLELCVPVAAGTRVEVLVLTPEMDRFGDLVAAAGTSTHFWDNRLDDEDWNDA